MILWHISPRNLWMSMTAILFAVWAGDARAEGFEPTKTWAVIAGVLEWEDPELSPFPKENRKDEALFETLGAMGVPESQRVLLLDRQATRSAVSDALKKIAKEAPADATVIFYYAGHGVKDEDGRIIFATSDLRMKKLDKTGLPVEDLPKMLHGFRGKRVLLLADCCYSGGLEKPARALAKSYEVAALTSAEASNLSTGDWTYSQTLLDALKGRPILDPNADGRLTLGEVADEIEAAMKYREQQRAGYVNLNLSEDWLVTKTRGEVDIRGGGAYPPRSWVLAPRASRVDIARVLEVGGQDRPGQRRVEFFDYADTSEAWVSADALKVQDFPTEPVGASIKVRWKGKTYDARVKKVEGGFMFVTYAGYGPEWDEWMTAARVVRPKSQGKAVEVLWKGKWYGATLKSEREGQWCVSYDGYDSSWDECVGRERIRF
jgi:hypothetical protein